MDEISSIKGYKILVLEQDPHNISQTSEYDNTSKQLIIFDDIINQPKHIQNIISNYYTDGRHHNLSPIYLAQHYTDIPVKITLK